MFTTTRDRALAAAAAAEHAETYGAALPVRARMVARRIVAGVIGAAVIVLGGPAVVSMAAHAEDVRHCQTVHAAGASDSPESIRCETILFGK